MEIKFDKDKCLKLLKENKSLRKEGKSLWETDKAKDKELTRYLTFLEDQIFWESRKKYCQMLDLFVSKKITFEEFSDQFHPLLGSNLRSARMGEKKLEEKVFVAKSNEIDIQFNPKSCGFTEIISDLHSLLDIYDPDVTLEMNFKQPELLYYGMSEEYLRLEIEEYFLPQLEKYCKES